MVIMRILFLWLVLLESSCWAYQRPLEVPESVWEDLSPYFLPENHPTKKKLDKIFGAKSVTRSRQSILKAGFFTATPGKYTKVIVSGHFDLGGYVVKMYLDSEAGVNEAERFKDRVVGARAVRSCIEAYGLHDAVKTPRKWIYPIATFSDSGEFPKHFVLIAEDMRPLQEEESLVKWKRKISTRQLDAVFIVLRTVGLPDCTYSFNIPFCKDGRLAFLDTELNGLWPVQFKRIDHSLRGSRLDYWKSLTGR